MNLLIVTPFTTRDYKQAIRLFEWIGDLGGIKDNDVLLINDPGENLYLSNRVLLAARKVARSVNRVFTTTKHNHQWPQGPNAAFIEAAKYAKDKKAPFLWLEPDCVPIKKGWLKLIEAEYSGCKKPFMGEIVPITPGNGKPAHLGLMGVAVYPPTVEYDLSAPQSIPFDMHIGPSVVKDAHKSNAFQWFGGPGRERKPPQSLANIRPGTLLFHQDKEGVLMRLLGQQTTDTAPHVNIETKRVPVQQPVLSSKPPQDITVVITTHNRMQKLLRALESCNAAKVEHIVITATGYSNEDEDKIRALANDKVRVFINPTDLSNPSWINGISEAQTKWVHILHDDDVLLPHFLDIQKHLGDSYAYFPAKFHRVHDCPKFDCDGPVVERGQVKCSDMHDLLLEKKRLSITPVRGIFKRTDLLNWLTQAGAYLNKPFYLRPSFLVGNDLWIWLCASKQYGLFYSHPTPLVSLGCDPDSTTMSDVLKSKGKTLERIYDNAKKVFLDISGPPKKAIAKNLIPLHIVTIVLDGAPWLMAQLQTFNRLNLDWHWSIIEGTALPFHCTGWCKSLPEGHSKDNTKEILSDLQNHKRISVYSKPGWKGKLEMVNHPLANRKGPEVLLQVDCDEFWRPDQIETICKLFTKNPDRSHAMFWCNYFVGPDRVMSDTHCFANRIAFEWRRAWLRQSKQCFLSHEPPIMSGDQSKFFTQEETSAHGLVFDHYSYVLTSQVRFKEVYYGYAGAVDSWRALQSSTEDSKLETFFPWANNSGIVRRLK